jgi:hypothetical protein
MVKEHDYGKCCRYDSGRDDIYDTYSIIHNKSYMNEKYINKINYIDPKMDDYIRENSIKSDPYKSGPYKSMFSCVQQPRPAVELPPISYDPSNPPAWDRATVRVIDMPVVTVQKLAVLPSAQKSLKAFLVFCAEVNAKRRKRFWRRIFGNKK